MSPSIIPIRTEFRNNSLTIAHTNHYPSSFSLFLLSLLPRSALSLRACACTCTQPLVQKPPNPNGNKRCEGYWDDEMNCGSGLAIFKQSGNQDVPGCDMTSWPDYSATWYFCVRHDDLYKTFNNKQTVKFLGEKAQQQYAGTEQNYRLGHCEGHCQGNNECGEGLVCHQRDPFGSVPGCVGGDLDGTPHDYCVRQADVQ